MLSKNHPAFFVSSCRFQPTSSKVSACLIQHVLTNAGANPLKHLEKQPLSSFGFFIFGVWRTRLGECIILNSRFIMCFPSEFFKCIVLWTKNNAQPTQRRWRNLPNLLEKPLLLFFRSWGVWKITGKRSVNLQSLNKGQNVFVRRSKSRCHLLLVNHFIKKTYIHIFIIYLYYIYIILILYVKIYL